MGYLFENMEKMDIQWERQQKDLESQKRAEAEKKLQDVLADAEAARADAKNAKEQMLKSYINLLQEFIPDRDKAKKRIIKEYHLDEQAAERAFALYWK